MISPAKKAWIVAATIGAVEALKDQGIARWNGPLRSLHQLAKSTVVASYQTTVKTADRPSSSSPAAEASYFAGRRIRGKRTAEESMKKVMDLSCWGPSAVRF